MHVGDRKGLRISPSKVPVPVEVEEETLDECISALGTRGDVVTDPVDFVEVKRLFELGLKRLQEAYEVEIMYFSWHSRFSGAHCWCCWRLCLNLKCGNQMLQHFLKQFRKC